MDTGQQTIVVDRELRLRRMAESDIPLLARWLSDPRVLQFYEGRNRPHDEAMVREHYWAPDRSGIFQCIVEWRGQPIGYQQFYPSDPGEEGFLRIPPMTTFGEWTSSSAKPSFGIRELARPWFGSSRPT